MRMIADRIDALLADKGYDSDAVRDTLISMDVEAVIPARRNRRSPAAHDRVKYRWRNQIERLFNKLKNWRRVATRYDKLPNPTSASSASHQSCSGCPLSTMPSHKTKHLPAEHTDRTVRRAIRPRRSASALLFEGPEAVIHQVQFPWPAPTDGIQESALTTVELKI